MNGPFPRFCWLALRTVLALLWSGELLSAAPPREWIEPQTGHRVIRLSDDSGGSSLYFHQNTITPRGDKLVFDTRAGIVAVDLSKLGKEPLEPQLVVPGARAISVAWKTPDVYYRKDGKLCATNVDTGSTRELADLRGTVVNADETAVIGIERDDEAAAKVQAAAIPMLVTADLVNRNEPPGRLRPGGRSLAMAVTDLKSGTSRKVHYSTEWLNHLQASPTDPHRLLFCHEGAWHQVDRVWTVRTDGSGLKLLHRRTMPYEIAGHEFFSYDGEWVWYDLQTPRSGEFWLAGVHLNSGKRLWYPIAREQWSVHYNISRDGQLFAGDGGGPGSVANHTPLPEKRQLKPPGNGQWIYVFRPVAERYTTRKSGDETIQVGELAAEKLVDLSQHDYDLEPNVTITPDNQWVVFRSNMHGATHVYAAEIRKRP